MRGLCGVRECLKSLAEPPPVIMYHGGGSETFLCVSWLEAQKSPFFLCVIIWAAAGAVDAAVVAAHGGGDGDGGVGAARGDYLALL